MALKGLFKKPKGGPGKQIASELLPSRHCMAQITGGDMFYRSMGNYAKTTPADAAGVKTEGIDVLKLSKVPPK